MRGRYFGFLVGVLAVFGAPLAAHAGGPLFIDPATGLPIHYRSGPVQIYTDLGRLGPLSNEAADAKVAFAWKQWTDVPTSSFEAHIAGDFSTIGLPDITVDNVGDVIGTFNGGGIHVIYDADGTIMSDYFGLPPSVLGIGTPEFGVDGTPEITESWVVLNGAAIDPADTDGSAFAGVMTHEFGHTINLGHSQTNGAIVFFGDDPGPKGSESLPYAGAPTRDDVETMYPFIDVSATGSGVAQSTVDVTDDVVSVSNIYPAPGWPASAGAISGTITTADGATQVAGVNVVARNVANPWRDAFSAISGDVTRADASAAGRYTLNGLTPGADYVVYVDGIFAGGFSVPPAAFFPGPEEFYNGARESGDARADAIGDAELVRATAGATVTADIAFNANPGAPTLTIIGANLVPFDITADGKTIVGFGTDLTAPAFRWTDKGGVETLGGVGSTASIAPNGSAIVSNTLQDDGYQVASLYAGGTSWLQLPGLGGTCDGAQPITNTVAFGVSNGGSTVVGLGYAGEHCGMPRAFRWDAATNQTQALETPEDSHASRANGISGDGRIIWGWKEAPDGFRDAAIWIDGKLNTFSTAEFPVGEAFNASPNGKYVVGGTAGLDGQAWRWSARRGLERIGNLPDSFFSSAFAVNAKGDVMVGHSTSVFFDLTPFIWTPKLGMMRLDEFLATQGTFVDPTSLLYTPNSMSADGRRIAGVGASATGEFAWVLDIRKVKVCHVSPNDPTRMRTIEVTFPNGLDEHLAHGDVLGACSGDE